MPIVGYALMLALFVVIPWRFVVILLKEVRETSIKLEIEKRVNAALEQEHKHLRLQMSMPPERREG
jgi:hypothetical protein